MLAHVEPSSAVTIGILIVCLILVFGFDATNGFHDTANAFATVNLNQRVVCSSRRALA